MIEVSLGDGVCACLCLRARAGIEVCTGGTLFEYALLNNDLSKIFDYVKFAGIKTVEVSNGSIHIPTKQKHKMIKHFIDNDFDVYSEIGCKIANYDWRGNVERLVDEAKSDLDAGAKKVIVEARESGNSGIYTDEGELAPFMEILVREVSLDDLIFEVPKKNQQTHLIKKYGESVNFGNVKPEDVLSVESLRRGLRSDTLEYISNSRAIFSTQQIRASHEVQIVT